MEFNVISIVFASIGTILTVVWIALFVRGKDRYDEYIDVLDGKEYFLKDIYFIGYELISFCKVEFRDKYNSTREKKMGEIKGKKYAQFYVFANLAAELTFLITFSTLGFLIAVIAREPIFAGLGAVLGTLLVIYFEYVLINNISVKHEKMLKQFPHILSQMALLMNAGMTLRETVDVIVDKTSGPLTDEFRQMRKDIYNGYSDDMALKALADRCELAEIRKLTNTMIQNINKGGSEMAKSMIEMSNEEWATRISSTREQAEKASTKLLIPILIIFAGILLMVIVPMFMGMNS